MFAHRFLLSKKLISILLLISNIVLSQNLVPNPSFEDHTGCPNSWSRSFSDEMNKCDDWYNATSSDGTPDYFHTCGKNGGGIPYAVYSFQYASTGDGMAGLIAFGPSSSNREYIGINIPKLNENSKYVVGYKVNLDNNSYYSINGLGMLFYESSIPINTNTKGELQYQPQADFRKFGIIDDTLNWVLLFDTILIDKPYDRLIIGTFPTNYSVVTGPFHDGTLTGSYAYYFIDDVFIIPYDSCPPIKSFFPEDTVLCNGQVLELSVHNPQGLTSWNTGASDTSIYVSNSGIYIVDCENICGIQRYEIRVNYVDQPILDLGMDDTLCFEEAIILDAYSPFSNYTWQDGYTGSSYEVKSEGKYFVKVENVCSESMDTVEIFYENCSMTYFLPSAFSPNNDGVNDILYVRGENISSIDFKVFNRWGELIFQSHELYKGWDGTYQGRPCNTGIYTAYVKLQDRNGNIKSIIRQINLIR